jgi:hypothetical protein
VEDITEFERPALDLPGRPEAPRQYAVDTPPPAPVSWVTWLLLAATAAVVAAGGIGLALLLK